MLWNGTRGKFGLSTGIVTTALLTLMLFAGVNQVWANDFDYEYDYDDEYPYGCTPTHTMTAWTPVTGITFEFPCLIAAGNHHTSTYSGIPVGSADTQRSSFYRFRVTNTTGSSITFSTEQTSHTPSIWIVEDEITGDHSWPTVQSSTPDTQDHAATPRFWLLSDLADNGSGECDSYDDACYVGFNYTSGSDTYHFRFRVTFMDEGSNPPFRINTLYGGDAGEPHIGLGDIWYEYTTGSWAMSGSAAKSGNFGYIFSGNGYVQATVPIFLQPKDSLSLSLWAKKNASQGETCDGAQATVELWSGEVNDYSVEKVIDLTTDWQEVTLLLDMATDEDSDSYTLQLTHGGNSGCQIFFDEIYVTRNKAFNASAEYSGTGFMSVGLTFNRPTAASQGLENACGSYVRKLTTSGDASQQHVETIFYLNTDTAGMVNQPLTLRSRIYAMAGEGNDNLSFVVQMKGIGPGTNNSMIVNNTCTVNSTSWSPCPPDDESGNPTYFELPITGLTTRWDITTLNFRFDAITGVQDNIPSGQVFYIDCIDLQ